MVAKKKKQQGHYCRICSEYKANEQFSGKGHSRHICKECRSLPDDVKADMVRCNEVERAVFKCPMSRQDWELLEKYAKKYKDKESGQFAQAEFRPCELDGRVCLQWHSFRIFGIS